VHGCVRVDWPLAFSIGTRGKRAVDHLGAGRSRAARDLFKVCQSAPGSPAQAEGSLGAGFLLEAEVETGGGLVIITE